MLVTIVSALLITASTPALAAAPSAVDHGRTLARAYCSGCHATGPAGASPRRGAPPFRDLHQRYPVENLQEALAEGIMVGHPQMPEIRLWPDEVADLIAYLKSLETPPARTR